MAPCKLGVKSSKAFLRVSGVRDLVVSLMGHTLHDDIEYANAPIGGSYSLIICVSCVRFCSRAEYAFSLISTKEVNLPQYLNVIFLKGTLWVLYPQLTADVKIFRVYLRKYRRIILTEQFEDLGKSVFYRTSQLMSI